ncbi:MAG: NAD(P)-dependent alcohol dehydrogenase [Planctomycetales bacterium]|nr:NAD(P)-dependent alcohol dehydrogenase [Planctomycetales bacterium]
MLIRVDVAAIHVGDCMTVRGTPLLVRLDTGLFRPRLGIPGFDVVGHIVSVGAKVTDFKLGERVFGVVRGGCAEFAVGNAKELAPCPTSLSDHQAAALPTSGLAALHALRDVGKVGAGDQILINGASGAVGGYAVQIAKSLGANVTGVCSARNAELVRNLGADDVVDYESTDFTRLSQQFDVVLDNVENRSLAECRRIVAPQGTLILNSGTGARGFRFLVRLLKPLILSPFTRQRLRRYLSTPNREDLLRLAEMALDGRLYVTIDRRVTLGETSVGLRYIETGRAHGKVLVEVAAST